MILIRPLALRRLSVPAILALLLTLLATPAWAGPPESIRLTVSPSTIEADGSSTATITAEVRDRDARPVSDDEVVYFSTTLGTIESAAKVQGGQASVRLTSAVLPGIATVTASAGNAKAQASVTFTNKPVTDHEVLRSVSIRADYLLYNDYEQVVDAVGDVEVRAGEVEIVADRAQMDLNRNAIIAQGQPGAGTVSITVGDTTWAVDKLRYSWDAHSGYVSGLQEPVRGLYTFHTGTMVPQKVTSVIQDDTFTLRDLVPSPLSIMASRVILMPGAELQFTRAQIMLNGKRRVSLPIHVMPLGPVRAGQAQYVGVGPRGPLLDIPYYVAAGEDGTSQFRLKYNAPEGLYGATISGWALDLISKYNLDGAAEGNVALTRVTSPDWGLSWTHSHTLSPATRAHLNLDTRAGYGLSRRYSVATGNLWHQGKGYSLNLTGFANKFEHTLADVSLSVNTKARPLGGGFSWNVGSQVAHRWTVVPYQDPDTGDIFFERDTSMRESVSARLNSPARQVLGARVSASLGSGLSFSRGQTRRAILGTVGAHRPLGRNGSLQLTYNFNDYGTAASDRRVGLDRQTLTASMTYGKYSRWTASAFATFGLERNSQNIHVNAMYNVADNWRLQASASLFRQIISLQDGGDLEEFRRAAYQSQNVEVRLTRLLGERALAVVYESYRNRVYLDYQPGAWW